jgi:peptidoglycan/xylan/chitin deacetylase (PgdA/CDA1 family)
MWNVREGDMPNRLVSRVLPWAYRRGLTTRIGNFRNTALTVVCYHRIGHPLQDRFVGFTPNISASPEGFERQIDYLCEHFSPIGISELNEFINGHGRLPSRPVLITFDDGYKDNAEIAWPVLQRRKLPAVVFLATDHIGTARPFLWDFAAFCFHYTEKPFADVPQLGPTHLTSWTDRARASEKWMLRSKSLPASDRWFAAQALRRSLAVGIPDKAFSDLYMTWDDVRRLAQQGLDFGGHTRTHSILTKLSTDEARGEIVGSYDRIASELGRRPAAFAYPNGSRLDFNTEHESIAREAGYSIGFSLEPGPISLAEVRQRSMAIPRIYVGLNDDMARFSAKLAGAWQFGKALRRKFGYQLRI